MENEPDLIRQQMSETRTSLTEKLESLENQVVHTMQGATASVTETVESVREAVRSSVASVQDMARDTVDTVKDTFDIGHWVKRYPWASLGGSVAAGFVLGSLLRPRTPQQPESSPSIARYAVKPNGLAEPVHKEYPAPPSKPSWWSEVGRTFESETGRLKGLALATVLGVARDYIKKQVPGSVAPQLAEIIDGMTQKLGGQPIRGPVLHPECSASTRT